MRGAAFAVAVSVVACSRAPDQIELDKLVLDTAFRSEGVAILDVDGDGVADLATDQYWYAGPDFTPHEIRTPEVDDPASYSHCSGAWGDDIDGDGWPDLVVAPFPTDAMYWYANPRDDGHWVAHEIAPAMSAGMELPIYVDLFGEGKRVLIMGVEPALVLAWFVPGADPAAPWVMHSISPSGFSAASHYSHGLGIGDIDGDGRADVLTNAGWFQQTSDRDVWTFHPFDFGPDQCSAMLARDLDGDGKTDVVCPHPHSYGIHWWQQQGDGFVEHIIDDSISQMHAAAYADLDGDGVPELISGKTWLAHPQGDPGTDDPALLVYYTADFERHVIDDDSGVGRQIAIGDLDGDGRPDLAISNKKGLFVFRQRLRR